MRLQGPNLEQLAAAFVLGRLASRTRRRFQTLLAQDIIVRRSWLAWEERLSGLAQEPPAVRPPDHAWAAIEQRLQARPAQRFRISQRQWTVIAALVVAAALIMVWMKLPRQ